MRDLNCHGGYIDLPELNTEQYKTIRPAVASILPFHLVFSFYVGYLPLK
jgi:hypothetical protein